MKRKFWWYVVLWLFPVFILIASGCQTVSMESSSSARKQTALNLKSQEDNGIISVFLNLEKPDVPNIDFLLSSLEIKGTYDWSTLSHETQELNTRQLGSGQILVGRDSVFASSYEKLRLKLKEPYLLNGNQQIPLTLHNDSIEILLSAPLRLAKGESRCIFITLDVEKSLETFSVFNPQMSASLQAIPIIANLLFVACPDIDTVYFIRADTNRVIASIGISGNPAYLCLDPEKKRLYVLAPGESVIKVVELNTIQVVDKIFLSLDNKPDYMTLGEDYQSAYVLDSLGNTVVLIDLTSGTTVERATINYNPEYAVYLSEESKLAVSLSRSSSVNLLNPATLEVTSNILTGNGPMGLAASEGFLFVAESNNNSILVYNIKDQKQGDQIAVGFFPTRILANNNQIYVANSASGSISVISPQILQVIREIPVARNVGELAASTTYNWLYAESESKGGITVIDLSSSRIETFIDLNTPPLGLAVLD